MERRQHTFPGFSTGRSAVNAESIVIVRRREPWNKGKLVGQKAPLRLKDIWAIRIRLQLGERIRELAMFNLAVDSKLRSCDLVKLRVRDITHGDRVAARAIIMQQKTQRPVQFEITEQTREAVTGWIQHARLKPMTSFSRAECAHRPTSRHGNTRESSAGGSGRSDSMPQLTGPIRCDAPRRP